MGYSLGPLPDPSRLAEGSNSPPEACKVSEICLMRTDTSGHFTSSRAKAAVHVSGRRGSGLPTGDREKVHQEIKGSTSQRVFHSHNLHLNDFSTKTLTIREAGAGKGWSSTRKVPICCRLSPQPPLVPGQEASFCSRPPPRRLLRLHVVNTGVPGSAPPPGLPRTA